MSERELRRGTKMDSVCIRHDGFPEIASEVISMHKYECMYISIAIDNLKNSRDVTADDHVRSLMPHAALRFRLP